LNSRFDLITHPRGVTQGASMRVLFRLVILIALHTGAPAALAQGEPVLMLDTGGHTGLIATVIFSADGKQLISAGYDKVIRVWDWEAGRTLRNIRGQVSPGDEGRIFTMALSPDGARLAVAGQLTAPGGGRQQIRIYDFATGELVLVLTGHTRNITALAFSPDGTRLASGSQDRSAILWDIARARQLTRFEGHKDEVAPVSFTPDGARLITASFDRTLRLWSVRDGRLIAELTGHAERVSALAVSPSGNMMASGSLDGEIRLWDHQNGRGLRILGNQRGAQVGVLRFSGDGRLLLSTCGGGFSCGGQPQYLWDIVANRAIQGYIKHDNVVFAAAFSPDGRHVATAGGNNHEIHIWDALTAETKQVLKGTGAPVWATGFAAAGSALGWGQTWVTHDPAGGYGPLSYRLDLPRPERVLGRPEPLPATSRDAYARARTQVGLYTLSHHTGGAYGYDAILTIAKSGKTVARIERGLTTGFEHRSYTFSPDGTFLISGGNTYLADYDLRGRMRGRYIGHEGAVWSVAASPDGGLLVSGGNDQTVRLWNLATQELIVTLFYGSDGEWVMWTPQGYYTGSPGADKIVGWQVNKGAENAAEFVTADQLRAHLNRPDIIQRAIILRSAAAAVIEAPGTTFKLADLLARPIPRFRVLSPLAGSTHQSGHAIVRIGIEATPDPIRVIRVQVNGRQVRELTPPVDSGGFAGPQDLDVPLAAGSNDVRITLANGIGEKTAALRLVHAGQGELDRRGTLHILAVGVDDYKGLGNKCGPHGCDLRFSSADARAFADAMEKRLGPGHDQVEKRVLVNGADPKDAPTASNIIDAVELLRHTEETDTVVIFFAGHGMNEGPSYRFLPTDAEWSGGALRGSKVVPWQVLQEALQSARGRRLLFVDTCHSGNAYNQRLGNTAYHENIIAYTAARFDQLALEDGSLGHGLFTYAVVEGLDGKGTFELKRQMSTRELGDYVIERVNALATAMNSEQEPQYFRGRDAIDYVLAHW
jgi:WD40 repeat protein